MKPIRIPFSRWILALCVWIFLADVSLASLGDRLPEFKDCLESCKKEHCETGQKSLPIHLRLLLWDCPSNCDYSCQHVVTNQRLTRDPPMLQPVVQYHGKWPFHRVMGIQELFSTLFSLFNYLAHYRGIQQVKERIPQSYSLRKYYLWFGYFGLASWTFSMIFHTRDFALTEKLDYFAAGASVLYGLYLAVVRIFRLDKLRPHYKPSLLRGWTLFCMTLFTMHVSYLTFWSWDYTYNMAANVAAGIIQDLMWTIFSVKQYKRYMKSWTAWPSMIVGWVILAMSLELLDFPPIGGLIDAHSLWHLGTVIPTIWWYAFLIRDAEFDITEQRLRA